MLCGLAAGAKDMSYSKASRHITGGKINRQTVMNCVRESRAEATESTEKRAVSELHIEADKALVILIGGKKSIVPLVSVYEGIENKYRNNYDKEIREALNEENLELYEQLTDSLIMQNPDRAETISQNAAYLQRFVKGISICKKDERANNGGCTEPHISHVLAARLSSRPLAWSETTLKHLAPILAAGKLTLNRKSTDNELVTLPLIHYLAFSKKFSYKNLTRTGEFRCLTFICRRDII